MIPAVTIYTDNLPEGTGGTQRFFVVRIRPKYKNDIKLHDHEYEHVRQWWVVTILSAMLISTMLYFYNVPLSQYLLALSASVSLYGLMYTVLRPFRMYCEASAYAKQVKEDKSDLDLMAFRLNLPMYKLNSTQEKCKAEIEKYL